MQLKMPNGDLSAVPYLEQYIGEWAMHEPHFRALGRVAENLNIQLHLEQKAPEARATAAAGGAQAYEIDNGIVTFHVQGTLMKHVSSMSANTSLALLRRQVNAAAADAAVLGVMFKVDSPGGTVAGTPDLASAIRSLATKKPTASYIEDLGASGAYWLASQTHRIAANSNANVGSIGVFQVVEDFSAAAEAEGVKVHVVRAGEFKGLGTPGTEITEEHLAYIQERIDMIAEDFVGAVAKGRKLPIAKARELADGRVHIGKAAAALGLVDAIESFEESMAKLVRETKQTKTTTRPKAVSKEQEDAGAEATVTTLKPLAATIAELREHCEGASDSFILGQFEKQATLASAMKAHAGELVKQNKALAAEKAEAEKKAAEAAAKPKPRGNQPGAALEGGEPQAGDGAAFLADFNARVKDGQDRVTAMKGARAANPDGYQAYIDDHNASHQTTDEARQEFIAKKKK